MTVDRTPKPCLHKQANHEHGTRLAYVLDKCRCLPCCAANSAAENQRARLRAYGRGTPTGLVDAAPVRAHVEALQAAGLGWRRVAERAGVANGVVSRLLFGKKDGDRRHGPSKRLNPVAAEKLLAVPLPGVDSLMPGARVDGTGTGRRLQALACLGWSINRLAQEAGADRQRLDAALHGRGVVASTARLVAELYDRLWDQPAPAATHYERISVSRARARAEAAGWAPPLAWDDDSIDDPAAAPTVDDEQPAAVDEHAIELVLDGQRMALTGPDLEAAALALAERELNYTEIAARVHSDPTTVRRVLNSARKRLERAQAREAA